MMLRRREINRLHTILAKLDKLHQSVARVHRGPSTDDIAQALALLNLVLKRETVES